MTNITDDVRLTLTKDRNVFRKVEKSYSKHFTQFCSIYIVSRILDGDALHNNKWFSQAEGI